MAGTIFEGVEKKLHNFCLPPSPSLSAVLCTLRCIFFFLEQCNVPPKRGQSSSEQALLFSTSFFFYFFGKHVLVALLYVRASAFSR